MDCLICGFVEKPVWTQICSRDFWCGTKSKLLVGDYAQVWGGGDGSAEGRKAIGGQAPYRNDHNRDEKVARIGQNEISPLRFCSRREPSGFKLKPIQFIVILNRPVVLVPRQYLNRCGRGGGGYHDTDQSDSKIRFDDSSFGLYKLKPNQAYI